MSGVHEPSLEYAEGVVASVAAVLRTDGDLQLRATVDGVEDCLARPVVLPDRDRLSSGTVDTVVDRRDRAAADDDRLCRATVDAVVDLRDARADDDGTESRMTVGGVEDRDLIPGSSMVDGVAAGDAVGETDHGQSSCSANVDGVDDFQSRRRDDVEEVAAGELAPRTTVDGVDDLEAPTPSAALVSKVRSRGNNVSHVRCSDERRSISHRGAESSLCAMVRRVWGSSLGWKGNGGGRPAVDVRTRETGWL